MNILSQSSVVPQSVLFQSSFILQQECTSHKPWSWPVSAKFPAASQDPIQRLMGTPLPGAWSTSHAWSVPTWLVLWSAATRAPWFYGAVCSVKLLRCCKRGSWARWAWFCRVLLSEVSVPRPWVWYERRHWLEVFWYGEFQMSLHVFQ